MPSTLIPDRLVIVDREAVAAATETLAAITAMVEAMSAGPIPLLTTGGLGVGELRPSQMPPVRRASRPHEDSQRGGGFIEGSERTGSGSAPIVRPAMLTCNHSQGHQCLVTVVKRAAMAGSRATKVGWVSVGVLSLVSATVLWPCFRRRGHRMFGELCRVVAVAGRFRRQRDDHQPR
jgi:hypothetical protein